MWPFSEIRKLQKALALANETNAQSIINFEDMHRIVENQGKMIDLLQNGIEVERMRVVACGVAAMANTRESAVQQRVSKDSPYWCASVQDVHNAVDREMHLREDLDARVLSATADIETKLGIANERTFHTYEAHVVTMDKFHQALDIIGKVVKSKLQGDMRDNAQEAEKFYNLHRGTKVCVMCGSEMIPLHSEDKKICSNGACGYEVEWSLEPGQKYQHKNNVEPFIEDRSLPEEPRNQVRL